MRRNAALVAVLLVLAVSVPLAACTSKPSLPEGFPAGFPLPEGRRVDAAPAAAGEVQLAVEAYGGISDVEAFYRQKLAGTKWQPVDGNPQLFRNVDPASVAELSDGTRTVQILITDLGNTTKVLITVARS